MPKEWSPTLLDELAGRVLGRVPGFVIDRVADLDFESESALANEDREALHLIGAHCRHAVTMLRRGVLGVRAAEEWLLNLEDACRRRFPDITDTAPGLARTGAEFRLLPVVPSAKVARAFPRLIAEVSPVIEWRSPRIITAWISQLLDPSMQRELRRLTPAVQLEAVTSPPRRRTGTASALRDATERAEQELVKTRAHRDYLRTTLVAERARGDELEESNAGLRARAKDLLQRLRKLRAAQAKQIEAVRVLKADNKAYATLCERFESAREQANLERDQAIGEREQAIGERDQAIGERDEGIRERDQAIRERDEAYGRQNQAHHDRSRAVLGEKVALRERDSFMAAEAAALGKCERLESELVQLRGEIDERVALSNRLESELVQLRRQMDERVREREQSYRALRKVESTNERLRAELVALKRGD